MIQINDRLIDAITRHVKRSKYKKYFNFTYKCQKYELKDKLIEIMNIIRYGIPWRVSSKIPYSTLYSTYKRLLKFNILEDTYIDLLNKYFKKSNKRKLKIQITDTTSIHNRCGSKYVNYNGHKKMKCTLNTRSVFSLDHLTTSDDVLKSHL